MKTTSLICIGGLEDWISKVAIKIITTNLGSFMAIVRPYLVIAKISTHAFSFFSDRRRFFTSNSNFIRHVILQNYPFWMPKKDQYNIATRKLGVQFLGFVDLRITPFFVFSSGIRFMVLLSRFTSSHNSLRLASTALPSRFISINTFLFLLWVQFTLAPILLKDNIVFSVVNITHFQKYMDFIKDNKTICFKKSVRINYSQPVFNLLRLS